MFANAGFFKQNETLTRLKQSFPALLIDSIEGNSLVFKKKNYLHLPYDQDVGSTMLHIKYDHPIDPTVVKVPTKVCIDSSTNQFLPRAYAEYVNQATGMQSIQSERLPETFNLINSAEASDAAELKYR